MSENFTMDAPEERDPKYKGMLCRVCAAKITAYELGQPGKIRNVGWNIDKRTCLVHVECLKNTVDGHIQVSDWLFPE